ncbi:MAG: ATP-binding protein, partial [Bacteroidales bacterium]|nr:ATP-binding protein [Bacteroidales bacterium]
MLTDKMIDINPFVGKSYAKGNQFIGREEELKQLWNLIHYRVGGISVYGQQRIGKTSIARKIFAELKAQNKPSIWIDLGEKESSDALFTEMETEILKLCSEGSSIRKCLNDHTQTSAYLRFKVLLEIVPKTENR